MMDKVVIRQLIAEDVDAFPAGFAAQGWQKPRAQFERYLDAQAHGAFEVLVAEVDGKAVGYLLLKPSPHEGPFKGQDIPEIVDFNVLEAYQRQGIGGQLLDEAERRAGDRVTLGVGLHRGYGPAQRLYVKRGYVPDGSGVWYENKPAAPNETCINDDDLVLYMVKDVRSEKK